MGIQSDADAAYANNTPVDKGDVLALWAQVQAAGICPVGGVGGTENAITGTLSDATVVDGLRCQFVPVTTNTGAVTLALNGGAARQVRDADGAVLVGGELVAGRIYLLAYVVNVWRLVSCAMPPNDAAWLKDRANHTGEQPISTVSGLGRTLDQLAIRAAIQRVDAAAQFVLPAPDLALGDISADFTAAGAWGLPVDVVAQAGPSVSVHADGLRFFPAGDFLRGLDVGTVPYGPYKRIAVSLDLTVHGPVSGTTIIFRWDTASDKRLTISTTGFLPDGLFLVRLNGPGNTVLDSPVYYNFGERVRIVATLDFETGEMAMVEPDGTETTVLTPPPSTFPDPTEIRIGQNMDATIHQIALFAEE
jgi:hypothetical protein